MRKTYSRAVRLSAAFLARLTGADVAGKTFGIDPRTIREWLKGGDVPQDEWQAIEQTLLARGSEMTARGETRGLVQTLTGAGIASRNRRYGQLIAQRESRRAGEAELEAPPDPIPDAIHALREDQKVLMATELRYAIESRQYAEMIGKRLPPEDGGGSTQQAGDERMLAGIAGFAAMTPEQVQARLRPVQNALTRVRKLHKAAIEAEQRATRQPEPAPPVPDAPVEPPAPPQPKLRAVDDYGEPWQWQPYRRYDR